MRKTKQNGNERGLTASEFRALPLADKKAILASIEAESPEQRRRNSRPLNATEHAQWARFQTKVKKRMGRPRIGGGSGTRTISLSIERDLLEQADDYAHSHGLKRSELFALSVIEKIKDTRK